MLPVLPPPIIIMDSEKNGILGRKVSMRNLLVVRLDQALCNLMDRRTNKTKLKRKKLVRNEEK